MNKTLGKIVYLFSAIMVAKLIGLFKSFWLAKILEPSDYGLWVSILLISSFSPITSLGVVEALRKKVPFYIGKHDTVSKSKTENGVFSSLVLSSLFTLIVGAVILFLLQTNYSHIIPYIGFMILAVVIGYFFTYFYHRFSAYQNFKMVSILDTLRAILILPLQISLGFFWGLWGAVLGFLICEGIVCIVSAVLNISMHGKIWFNFNPKLIMKLIKIGFPITIVWWIYSIQVSIDRLFCISLLGKSAAGFYGIGVAITSMFILIPLSISRVLYPRMNEEYGKTENKNNLRPLILQPSRALSMLMPYLIIIVLFLLPFIYKVILPKYGPGLYSAQILVLGVFFGALIKNGANFLIATNREKLFFKYVISCLIINIIGNFVLVKVGLYIEGIAISTTFSNALLTTFVWVSVLKELGYSSSERLRTIINLYLPFIILLAILIIPRLTMSDFLERTDNMLVIFQFVTLFVFSVMLLSIPMYRNWIKSLYAAVTKKRLKK